LQLSGGGILFYERVEKKSTQYRRLLQLLWCSAYILKQKNGSYASGYYDWIEGVFKAGGSAKKILWDGIKISFAEAKRLITKYSRLHATEMDGSFSTPDWILLPDEASSFLEQSDQIRLSAQDELKKLQKRRRFFN